MINVHDNRKTNERKLKEVEVGKFFMYYDILFRRCFWSLSTFDKIEWPDEYIVCMNMNTGEVLTISSEAYVEPISDGQVQIMVED